MKIPNLAINYANKYKKQISREIQFERSLMDKFETSIVEMMSLLHN